MLDHLPATARAIIEASAAEYEVSVPDVMKTWPRERAADVARRAAITRLSNERFDDDSFRYSMAELAEWFDTTRTAINRYRVKSPEYVRRKLRR